MKSATPRPSTARTIRLLVLWRGGGRVELPVASKRELARALTGLIIEQYLAQARPRATHAGEHALPSLRRAKVLGHPSAWMPQPPGLQVRILDARLGASFRCRSMRPQVPPAWICAPASMRRWCSSRAAELIATGLSIHLSRSGPGGGDPAAFGPGP
jgi:hypothetical protein